MVAEGERRSGGSVVGRVEGGSMLGLVIGLACEGKGGCGDWIRYCGCWEGDWRSTCCHLFGGM